MSFRSFEFTLPDEIKKIILKNRFPLSEEEIQRRRIALNNYLLEAKQGNYFYSERSLEALRSLENPLPLFIGVNGCKMFKSEFKDEVKDKLRTSCKQTDSSKDICFIVSLVNPYVYTSEKVKCKNCLREILIEKKFNRFEKDYAITTKITCFDCLRVNNE